MEVPIIQSFDEIYPEDAKATEQKRWNSLLKSFEEQYGRKAEFVSRSPGRVNIIGEHIDYSLYECVPMAITADVLLAVAARPDDSKVRISNVVGEDFPAREFDIPSEGEIPIDATEHEWSNYFKAGARGALELLRKRKTEDLKFKGMDILVNGNVPAGGGLSSSAAFVCASALAVMIANGEKNVGKKELVEAAIVSERSVGVNSGGLDQAASVFAERGSALHVTFVPSLTATPVHFPSTGPELVFLIAQSLVTSEKHVTAPIHYNLRVVEDTFAALFLSRIFRLRQPLPPDASPLGVSLRTFHDAYFEQHEGVPDNKTVSPAVFTAQLQRLLALVDDYLNRVEGYTRADIAAILGLTPADLDARYTARVPVRASRFMLRQRALHVFGEALRVQHFLAILRDASASPAESDATDLPKALGQLLADSHTSCADLYACSCPELDALCDIASRAGAYGSRLTGAGWGGGSVHLVPPARVERVRAAWAQEFYRPTYPELSDEEVEAAVVVSRPGRGSCVWEVQGREEV